MTNLTNSTNLTTENTNMKNISINTIFVFNNTCMISLEEGEIAELCNELQMKSKAKDVNDEFILLEARGEEDLWLIEDYIEAGHISIWEIGEAPAPSLSNEEEAIHYYKRLLERRSLTEIEEYVYHLAISIELDRDLSMRGI